MRPDRLAGPSSAAGTAERAMTVVVTADGAGDAAADLRWMRRALELAENGRHTVSPNPLVGCVVVRDGGLVGAGWHDRAGAPHAEVAALAAAGPAARGATAYVTLEPCAHTGRTGPCTRALLDAGVARVVAALADPHPLAGGGAGMLRAAGVVVDVGVGEAEARRQNEVFLHGVATGRPFVTVKLATSLDGRIAAADGTSRWLTGPAAREQAHALRARADAVVVGSGTALADDPLLTCRLAGYRGEQPLRVVLDRRGRVPPDRRLFDDAAPALRVTGPATPPLAGVADLAVDTGAPDGGLAQVLAGLWDRDVRAVLVEGGAEVSSAFLRANLADRVVVHVAAVMLGESGRPSVVGPWPGTLADAPRWRLEAVEHADDDAVLTLAPRPAEDG
jgi:diaminohydroxyphosphoribosylaminopyrimidine deaminase / 5-amino-6-(5-phosphoribosylamino)uracil reductase